MKMRTIGVSTDWSISEGIAFLQDAGEWSEIVVGNNWYNSAVIEHVWGVKESFSFRRKRRGMPNVDYRDDLLRITP